MAKTKRTSSDTKDFGAERRLSPRRLKSPARQQVSDDREIGQSSGGGRPPLMKK